MFIWSCLLSIQSAQTIDCFSKFGIPLQPGKQEGPSACRFLQYPQWALLPDFEISSDASEVLGYSAVFQGHWFSGAWLLTQVSQSIKHKELCPIMVAAYLWGPLWAAKQVNFLSDNCSVVEILRYALPEPLPSFLDSRSVPVGSSSLLLFHCPPS